MPRYGTPQYIGWSKKPRRKVAAEVVDPQTGKVTEPAKFEEGNRKLTCDPSAVVALTHDEWERYGRLYEKRIADKALCRREPPAATEPAPPSQEISD